MPKKRSALVVSALAAAAAALPAQAAEAKTYCVGKLTYTCPAGSISTGESLQYALNLAQADKEADTIKIGPGTFTGPSDGWDTVNDSPVTVTGSGPKATILDGTSQSISNPAFETRSATVERLKVIAPVGKLYSKGIVSRLGTIRDVAVVNPGEQGQGIVSHGSTIQRVNVKVTGAWGTGIYALPDYYSTTVIDSYLTAEHAGLMANGGNAYVTRTRTYKGGVGVSGATLNITDSVIRLEDGDGDGVWSVCGQSAAVTSLNADHVTVLGGEKSSGAAARCLSPGLQSKTTIRNSILATGKSLLRSENAGRSDIFAYTNLLGQGDKMSEDAGPLKTGKITLSGNLLGTPTFVAGTVALPSGSYLIDKALPSKSTLDANKKARPVDGNGDGTAAGDLGALERQVP